MNKNRFVHGIQVVENVAVCKLPFDMRRWVEPSEGWRGLFFGKYHDYTTNACAIGWMARTPFFIREGLSFNGFGIPEYEGAVGRDAVASFFDINTEEVSQLFTGSHNHGLNAGQIVQNMKEFLGNYVTS